MSRQARHRRALLALGGAGLLHMLAILVWHGAESKGAAAAEPEELNDFAVVELLSDPGPSVPAREPVESTTALLALIGASDRLASDPQQASNQDANAPGQLVGSPAPGALGQEHFTDRVDTSYRSKALWNTPGAGQMQHTTALPEGRSSPEALERQPDPAFSDSKRNPKQARAGQESASEGLATQGEQGGAPGDDGEEWFAADPRFDSAPQARSELRDGAVRSSAESPRSEPGLLSAEASKRGPARQPLDAPSRSSRRVASPFDLGAPSRGTKDDELGAAGKRGQSSGRGNGRGSAAQVSIGAGDDLATTEASRSIPYFNSMYRRIDKELRFPKNLALALEQGETVLKFQLDPKGRVLALEIHKSSGFKEFDAEARRAFLAASPFGPVPPALLRQRDALTVIAPYYFRNPLIR